MKTAFLVLCLASFVGATTIAQAVIRGTLGDAGVTGTVSFYQATAASNVTVSVLIRGITKNPDALHGIHVHWWGDLSDYGASVSTGPHFGIGVHACPESDNSALRHVGDMGNWQATAGVISQNKTLDLLSLSGINSILGRAVVLHESVDDCTTQPNGASMARLAHGVIGKVNSTVYGGDTLATIGLSNLTDAILHLEKAAGNVNVTGTVWFTQTASGVLVRAQVFGITGPHGFHLHWWGDISSPDGLATGAHFNPNGSMHGVPDNAVRHYGDMGVIYHYRDGVAYYSYVNNYLDLNGPNSIIGRAVHVHANADDCVNPIGNGGARWAQGVVGIANVSDTTYLTATFAGVPTTQNGTLICAALTSSPASSASTGATSVASTAGTSTAVSSGPSSAATSRVASRASTTAGDNSPASIISMAWAVLFAAVAFCL